MPALAQDRVALVIGNAAYRNTPALANPTEDARAMNEVLVRLGFQVTLAVNLDRAQMVAALRQFGDRTQGAQIALLFFAGHGLQVARGGATAENYLVPVDARIADARDVEDETLSLTRVIERMEGAATRIVILDACRDNPLGRGLAAPGASRSLQRGLASPEGVGPGTLIAFATAPGRTAADGTGRNSPFTAALIEYLPSPGLELRQVLTRVRNRVASATQGRQSPWNNDGLSQDIFLVQPPPAPVPPAPPPAAASPAPEDLIFWQGIQASRDPVDFEAYLRRFPDGVFRELAERRLGALAQAVPRPRHPRWCRHARAPWSAPRSPRCSAS